MSIQSPGPRWCRFQCPAHHGVTVHADTCPLADPDRAVCDGCAAELETLWTAATVRRHLRLVEQAFEAVDRRRHEKGGAE